VVRSIATDKGEDFMIEFTQEEKQKLMVCAKAFFDDGQGDKDYPFKDVSEQYDEFAEQAKKEPDFWNFLNSVYEANKR